MLVVLGPFNEHHVAENQRPACRTLGHGIARWLSQDNVAVVIPQTLPSDLYADTSHPLTAGYAMLAEQIWKDAAFQRWFSASTPSPDRHAGSGMHALKRPCHPSSVGDHGIAPAPLFSRHDPHAIQFFGVAEVQVSVGIGRVAPVGAADLGFADFVECFGVGREKHELAAVGEDEDVAAEPSRRHGLTHRWW